jgi:hypothetical protein
MRNMMRHAMIVGVMLACWASSATAAPLVLAYEWQFNLTVDQVTPNDFITSTAIGQGFVRYDTVADHLNILISWTDLVGEIDRVHIHGPAAIGFNTRDHLVDVLLGASQLPAGTDLHTDTYQTVKHLLDPGDGHAGPHGGHYTGQQALDFMIQEQAYIMLHSSVYANGELKGQFVLTNVTVPEPGTGVLLGLGLSGLGVWGSRVRRSR